jgi:chitin disaccharide deacetylase
MPSEIGFAGTMRRALIVNADDFGQSTGINHGIVEAHERGIVTSASLMVRWDAAAPAAAYARAHPGLSVGLHIDVYEWMYRNGEWDPVYERVDCRNPRVLELEIRSQLSACRELLGRDPTHLDSHQHAHSEEPTRSILDRVAGELDVPLRHRSSGIRYEGRFYGQSNIGDPLTTNISTEALIELLRSLPEGVTELACHPGYADELVTMYRLEREMELQALCDPEVRRILREEEIELITFTDLAAAKAWPTESESVCRQSDQKGAS